MGPYPRFIMGGPRSSKRPRARVGSSGHCDSCTGLSARVRAPWHPCADEPVISLCLQGLSGSTWELEQGRAWHTLVPGEGYVWQNLALDSVGRFMVLLCFLTRNSFPDVCSFSHQYLLGAMNRPKPSTRKSECRVLVACPPRTKPGWAMGAPGRRRTDQLVSSMFDQAMESALSAYRAGHGFPPAAELPTDADEPMGGGHPTRAPARGANTPNHLLLVNSVQMAVL